MPTGPRPMTKAQIDAMAKRRKIYDLRAENHSWEDIGKLTGFEPATCEKYFREALKKDGLPPLNSAAAAGKARTIEYQQPDAAAAVIAGMAAASAMGDDPKFKDLREACKNAGMKPGLVTALIKRLQTGNYSVATQEVKRLVGKQLIEALEDKTALVLNYMDEFAVSQAGLKDLSIAANILIEKQQLLKNQPTQIIDFTARQQIWQLMPMMLAEAQRRGIPLTIEGTATRVDGSR